MEGYIKTGNLKIRYQRQERSGKAIVFLHNSSGSSAVWDQQWEDKCFKDYTLIRFDLPGHGFSSRSDRPDKDYSLPGMAQIIRKVIERLHPTSYIIAAVSLATNLTAEIARQMDGCKGYFLAGASVVGGGIGPEQVLLPFEPGTALFAENPPDRLLEKYIKGLVFGEHPMLRASLTDDYRNTDPDFRACMGASILKREWTDEMQNLADSGRPVSWIFGEQERIINADFLRKAPASLWRDTTFFLPEAGHLVHLDRPADFNRLLLDFATENLAG